MTNGRKSNSRTFKDDDPDSARIPSYGASGGGNIESKPLRIRSAWTAQSPNPDTTSSSVVLLPPQPERDHRSPSKNPNNENGAPTTIGGGDVLLQWGHKKRSRGARVENRTAADEASARQAARIHRRSAAAASSGLSEKSAAAVSMPPAPVSTEKLNMELFEWPRIYISLSRKEKEDDFFVMKGTKLPQRPKKRAKNIDKALQYCFPGMWLSELTRGRYEVREKKCVKKKRRGLKGLESMDSDSD
ncbi:hypothetical protein QJS04_geneDACA017079 [Acorus gramineus]|uniref:DUF1639 domain-containing protein n=1 Tax=Acorus gramineus TaxID=55184 RepID=A0AAV9AYG6_ACOGR|nr:hypothetical protein QJS04_geneDACA017079 [Acorus gramineus]